MKDWLKAHKFPVALFLCALLVRIVLFSINFSVNDHNLVPTIKGDDGYYELSQNINAGNGFTFDEVPPFRPNPLRPPLWPILIAFIAKIFGSYWAVLILELILGSFIPVLGYYVASRLVGQKLSKWVAGLLVFEPYSILLSFILYTETSFTFFFLIFLIFLFRYIEKQTLRNAVWTGVFLGLACLIKPTVQFFPIFIPIALAILWRKNLAVTHLKQAAAFLLAFFVIIAPWLWRNHQEFGVWGISAQPSFNLYVYLVPTVLSIDNDTNFQTELEAFALEDNFDVNDINLSNADFYKEEAIKVLLEHKTALIKSAFISGVTFFTHDGMLTVLQYSGITIPNVLSKPVISLIKEPIELIKVIGKYIQSPAVLILMMRLVWILITLLFFVGVFLMFKRQGLRPMILAAFLMILYFAATTCINGLGVNARFRIPVNVFIFSFAIYAIFAIKERLYEAFRSHSRV